jgi:hypothetical protein
MKTPCTVCDRDFGGKRKPLCTGCAQATLYPARIHQASSLIDREKHHTHAEAVLRPGNDGIIAALSEEADWDAVHAAVTAGVRKQSVVKAKEEQAVIDARINDITDKAAELRQQIEDYKQYIAQQKLWHVQRQQDLRVERKELEKQQARTLEPVSAAMHKARQRLEKVHKRTFDAQALLCHEIAYSSGLRKQKGKNGRSKYWIGGVPLPDLRELNGKLELGRTPEGEPEALSHELATAAMDHVCRLVSTVCHYLSVRLPAEILLPTTDFPHAMILPEKASYKSDTAAYQELLSSAGSSPVASRLLDRGKPSLSRPRPLSLDKPLHELLKQDPKTFGFYIEGVALLAWNVAWLCRSQGFDTVNNFDDICSIGKNLYQLLIATPLSHIPSTPRLERAKSATPTPPARLGSYSHGSVYNSLSGHQSLARFEKWRLATPSRTMDKLRAYLQNEIAGAEWDYISSGEWDEEEEHEKPVLVGGAHRTMGHAAMSIMTVKPSDDVDDAMNDARRKGNSGWMKVRGRGGDTDG